ncbi:AfsR/SARP family transcriptional regulator [Micromonospora sp. L32]|uniref:AfsR/SARP family transcriptional regulator n=1 Tax=Micromonospora sp. L32 TaxID=3452214 RepID=UPI003F8BC13B
MAVKWPRRLAALLALLLLLVVPPLLLLRIAGWPIAGMPSGQQMQEWVAHPLTEGTLTAGLTLLAWLIWLFVAYTAIAAAARRVRSGARWLRRLPLPTPLQATATSVAGAAALGAGHAAVAQPAEPVVPVTASAVDGSPISPDIANTVGVEEGVTIAGGWLPRETAEQVAAASVLVWLRRRRDYQPMTRSGPPHHDLAPLSTTVAAVRAALDVTTHADDPAGHSSPVKARAAGPLTVLPTAVALTGPGALHAGRGVLVTALLAALRQPTGPTPTVITRVALTKLLGPAAAVALQQGIPGLQTTASLEDALTLASGTAGKVLLISETVPAPAGSRLAAALDTGTLTAVVLGTSPLGAAWHVDVQGHTSEVGRSHESGARLCVLDQVATTDLLAVLTLTRAPLQRQPADATAVPRPRPPVDPVTLAAATAEVAKPTPSVHLRILGKPAVLADGRPVAVRRSAAWQGLILLAVHPEGLGARQLTEAIWPGIPAHTVTGRLYTTLSDLRRTIGAAAVHHRDDRYRLDPDHVDVDLWRLRAAAHRAATALTDHTGAWQKVIDAYTGDLATGHTWAWLDPPREATRRLVIDAYAAAAAAQSEPQRALELLEAALRVDPYNAHLHHRAADALTALGDHSGAAQLLHRYTHRLADAGLAPIPLGQTTPSSR